ncbi:DUF2238 domain-containing protein [Paenibacillus ginsengarvi]|uniref:DUF2238 domain-containing protein n=1 Tax=Paenibacillus ginsengarvi TaxID=400777 RepID=A0A3B0CK78_9BACL|nr:DUF2238 domain-containing protein [Paenibacillus ginsengarvi]RKN86085.1 DUF2238 domain-containing protein [Paenibacillus ginsengarvi]
MSTSQLTGGVPFRTNYRLHLLFAGFVIYWIALGLWPVQRSLWLAENVLVVLTVAALVWTYRFTPLSNMSYLFIALFLCLHTFATHFSYETTPIDNWLKATFHTKRSYYDRVVHFAFGLLWIYPFRQLFVRTTGIVRGLWPYLAPMALVVGLSAIFEITEMAVASLSGQGTNNDDAIGMQGDLYDTQKDMMLAWFGAIAAEGILIWRSRRKKVVN